MFINEDSGGKGELSACGFTAGTAGLGQGQGVGLHSLCAWPPWAAIPQMGGKVNPGFQGLTTLFSACHTLYIGHW